MSLYTWAHKVLGSFSPSPMYPSCTYISPRTSGCSSGHQISPRKQQPNCSGPTSPPSGQGGELSSPLTSSFFKIKNITCLTTFFIPVCVPSYLRKCKYACNLFSFHTVPIFSLSDIIPFKGLKHQIRIKIFLSMHHDKKKKGKSHI